MFRFPEGFSAVSRRFLGGFRRFTKIPPLDPSLLVVFKGFRGFQGFPMVFTGFSLVSEVSKYLKPWEDARRILLMC